MPILENNQDYCSYLTSLIKEIMYQWINLCLLWTFFIISQPLWAAGNSEKGKALYAVCVACHGPDGAGNKTLNAPAIAGQEIWYLERQLKNFKTGIRGTNSKDIYGMQMRPMAMTLTTEQAIADVATYVSTLKGKSPVQSIKGNVNAGKAPYMICQTCHGPKGEGNKALNAPKLINQQDWYIVRQLKNFKAGLRGAHPKDVYGIQMRPMSLTLPNDEAINNVVSYIVTFK